VSAHAAIAAICGGTEKLKIGVLYLRISTYAVRLLAATLLLLSVVPSAHAHGNGLVMLIALVYSPLHFAPFVCLFFLTGLKGRYGIAFGAYFAVFVLSWWLQTESWYHPLARNLYAMLPAGIAEFLRPSAIFNVLVLCTGCLVAIYFALRNWHEPIRFRLPAPLANLMIGGLFLIVGTAAWVAGLVITEIFPAIRSWNDGFKVPLGILWLIWLLGGPVLIYFVASYLFRARFFHSSVRRH
jgi:hypothetical protein